MEYKINHEMAVELLHRYLEKIYQLDKHKGKSIVKIQRLYDLNLDLKNLVEQMQANACNVDVIIREIKEELEQRFRYDKISVYVDGAARGNSDTSIPNESAFGFAVYADSQLLFESAVYLGATVIPPRLRNEPDGLVLSPIDASNNSTEYIALIEALKYLIEHDLKANHIEIFSDSFLVVSQVNMNNVTRAEHLIRLRNCAQELIHEFDNLSLTHIPRDQNHYVDTLINKLLDEVEAEKEV
jgi:ribonuclease HI